MRSNQSSQSAQHPPNDRKRKRPRLVTNYERTWWVRLIVRVFQTFGLLSYNWCECRAKYHKKGRPHFADGIDYNWSDEGRLIMEASSGQYHEDMQKTTDDNV
ncbi:hypothetical protein DFQ29_009289 [Apophysomyces sp. BC1021]|nr:hypothetical protein DFQ29_009289 [Apophysomyces sp. BC1021]